MNPIIWLILGGVVGWLASVLRDTDAWPGVLMMVSVGSVGATLGGAFVAPLFNVGASHQDTFSLPAMLIAFVGAAFVLAILSLARRGRVH